jgi:hypothetical protein
MAETVIMQTAAAAIAKLVVLVIIGVASIVVVSGENSRTGMSVPQSRRRFHAAMQPRWAFPEPHIFCHGLGERDDTFGVYFVAPKTRGGLLLAYRG